MKIPKAHVSKVISGIPYTACWEIHHLVIFSRRLRKCRLLQCSSRFEPTHFSVKLPIFLWKTVNPVFMGRANFCRTPKCSAQEVFRYCEIKFWTKIAMLLSFVYWKPKKFLGTSETKKLTEIFRENYSERQGLPHQVFSLSYYVPVLVISALLACYISHSFSWKLYMYRVPLCQIVHIDGTNCIMASKNWGKIVNPLVSIYWKSFGNAKTETFCDTPAFTRSGKFAESKRQKNRNTPPPIYPSTIRHFAGTLFRRD